MKYTLFALFLMASLVLTGCGSVSRAAENLDRQLDRAEETIESKVEDAFLSPDEKVPASAPAAAPTAPAAASTASTDEITAADAEQIALNHAGFTADQVKYLRTEYEIDDGRPQYEVTFHQDKWEYDYEIDARTGNILSFERDN